MKDTDFVNIIDFAVVPGGWVPANEKAQELLDQSGIGQIQSFKEVTARDLRLHKNYMAFLSYVWSYLPDKFKAAVPKKNFYFWLKHLQKNYKVIYEFKDVDRRDMIYQFLKVNKNQMRLTYKSINLIAEVLGKTSMFEYVSLSFGKMNNDDFKAYVKNQLPFLYTEVIGRFFTGEIYGKQ